jgi:predicted ATPase
LTTQMARRRLLTIVGPGGIGKTTMAIAVAQALSASYPDGVWFVGLASLADPELVPGTVSAALDVSLSGANPRAGLTAWLRDGHAMIVLDSCEHVVGAAAALAEPVLQAAPRVHILATSREPLRAEGEWVHRLAPLETPPAAVDITAGEAMRYSAVARRRTRQRGRRRVHIQRRGSRGSSRDLPQPRRCPALPRRFRDGRPAGGKNLLELLS